MSSLVFPARLRCVECRKKLTEENVLSGKFCSFKCGKFSAPAKNVDAAPRECKRQVGSEWGYKTRYSSPESVPQKYSDDPASGIYECSNCHRYHIGHSRADTSHDPLKEQLNVVVRDMKSLGQVIKKYREAKGIEKKMVAKALKIPAIRITELEEGAKGVSLETAFLVMNALRMNLAILAQAPRR